MYWKILIRMVSVEYIITIPSPEVVQGYNLLSLLINGRHKATPNFISSNWPVQFGGTLTDFLFSIAL